MPHFPLLKAGLRFWEQSVSPAWVVYLVRLPSDFEVSKLGMNMNFANRPALPPRVPSKPSTFRAGARQANHPESGAEDVPLT